MDKIIFKLGKLETLWEEFRRANEGDDYGNQSEWAKKQLEGVERELEATLREASMWKERLRAEIEDLLLKIHEMFHLFGRQAENTVLEAAGLPIAFNAKTRDRLQSLHDSLSEEINVTRNNLGVWIEGIKQIVKELGTTELDLSIENFENDLSTAAVQPIWFKYDALNRLISTRRDAFEDSAIKLHFYWTAFSYAPVDDIDHALAKLFADKPSLMDALNNNSNADEQASGTTNEKDDQVLVKNDIQNGDISVTPNHIKANTAHSSYTLPVTSKTAIASQISTSTSSLSTSTISTTSSPSSPSTPSERYTYFSTPYTPPPVLTYTYYSTSLPSGLFLSDEQLEALQNKVTFFERDYVERRDRRDAMVKTITGLWEELSIPEDDRRVIVRNSVEEEYLNELSAEHERLRAIMREIVQKAIEEYTAQLEDLWDKCLVPQSERAEFIVNLHEISSSEEVYHVLASEVARLQELYAKCAEIYRLMLERKSLIEKMIDFEKHASDPKRLFQSSFRLLEEEKWRKTCWPNLVRLEKRLVDACLEYETNERKPFMHEGKRYLEGLEEEISERVVNKMFFGFEHGNKTPAQARSRNITRPSAPVSPATSRPSSPTRASRRGSMYIDAKADTNGTRPQRGTSPSGRQSRRPSVAIPNGNETGNNTPSQSRRSSMYLDPNSAIRRPKRSSSVSSNSSTSSISSVSTPTSVTPDPRSIASALKKVGSGNSALKPIRASSIPVRPHTPGKDANKPQRRQTANVNGSRTRPKSVILTDSGNGLMGKKLINTKRMSVVSESKR